MISGGNCSSGAIEPPDLFEAPQVDVAASLRSDHELHRQTSAVMEDGSLMEDGMRARLWILGMAVAATAVVSAKEPLSLRVSPAISFAPANLVIRASIEPDADNRTVEVVVDSEEFYRSSMMQLDGDHAPKMTSFEFRSLPCGEYRITAVVIGIDGRPRATARAHVNVVESGRDR